MTLHLSGHQLLETCENKQEPRAFLFFNQRFSEERIPSRNSCLVHSDVRLAQARGVQGFEGFKENINNNKHAKQPVRIVGWCSDVQRLKALLP